MIVFHLRIELNKLIYCIVSMVYLAQKISLPEMSAKQLKTFQGIITFSIFSSFPPSSFLHKNYITQAWDKKIVKKPARILGAPPLPYLYCNFTLHITFIYFKGFCDTENCWMQQKCCKIPCLITYLRVPRDVLLWVFDGLENGVASDEAGRAGEAEGAGQAVVRARMQQQQRLWHPGPLCSLEKII